MARVLPVPAPASTHTGPPVASTTSRCSGSSSASSVSGWASGASDVTSVTRFSLRGTHAAPPVVHDPVFSPISRRRRVSGQLIMYTTTWCGFCRNLKRQLARDGIEGTEVGIERDPEAAEFVMSVNVGNQTVPTVVLPDGTALVNPSAAQVRERLAAVSAG